MTDRELLELAAKAAGLDFNEKRTPYSSPALYCGGRGWWNPITDDGDALRLAVKLRLELRPGTWAVTVAGDGVWEEVSRESSDDYAATRIAIVRAAAEIGKGMAPFPSADEIRENWT